jgi:hypothetical protein
MIVLTKTSSNLSTDRKMFEELRMIKWIYFVQNPTSYSILRPNIPRSIQLSNHSIFGLLYF